MKAKHFKSRHALLMSLTSLTLCVSMLFGATFAWFTDSVTSGVNRIVSGNLDVEATYWNGTNYDNSITSTNDLFVAPTGVTKGLWEPGHVEVAYLKITNAGTLALNYKLALDPASEITSTSVTNKEIKLSEILKYKLVDLTIPDNATEPELYADRAAAVNAASGAAELTGLMGLSTQAAIEMAPGDTQYKALIVYMPEETGNDANYDKSFAAPEINFSLSVIAQQRASESDSFNNTYDSNAAYPAFVSSVTTARAAKTVTKDEDGKTSAVTEIKANDNKVTATVPAGVQLEDGVTELTLEVKPATAETATITALDENTQAVAAFDLSVSGISAENDGVIISTITLDGVTGLTELYHSGVKMTPKDNAAEVTAADTYHFANGVLTLAVTHFSNFTYVYANPVRVVNVATSEEFADAMNIDCETLTINLTDDVEWETGAGHGTTPFVEADSRIKTLTIMGNNHKLTATGAGVGPIRAANEGTIVFKNLTIEDHSVSYAEKNWEFAYLEFSGKLVFDNCTFLSGISLDGDSPMDAKFTKCTFSTEEGESDWNPVPANMNSIWVSSGTVSIDDCDFNGPYRGVKIHEAYGSDVTQVTINNSRFTGFSKKPGIAIGTLDNTTVVSITSSTFTNCQPGDQNLYIYETNTNVDSFSFTAENNTESH